MSNIIFLRNLTDFNNINNGKIIIIKVGAEWCMPCKSIAPLYHRFADNNKNSNIIFTEINTTDADDELLDYINVKSLPTFLFYNNSILTNKIIGCDSTKLEESINNLYL
jgi:thioredoxin 1